MVPELSYVERLVRIGAPASVEVGGRALSVNLMLFVIGLFPTTVVAGYGIGVRVFSVVFLPAIAVARGVETMSGQNLGAGEPDRAAATNHFAAKTMLLVLTVVGALTWLFAEPVVAVFTDDAAVIDVGTTFLRYVAPTFGLIGVMRAYTGGFRGAGKTLVAAAVSILMLGIVRLPIAWVLARLDPAELAWLPIDAASVVGANGIWVSFAVSNVVGAVAALLWFRTGSWRDADPTDPDVGTAADD
jgi:Na+-driven multidrug efflux pump